jgi:hypothetical protein
MLQPVLKRGQQFVGLALAGFLAACGGPRISRQDGGAVVAADPSFKSAKLVYLPRTIARVRRSASSRLHRSTPWLPSCARATRS